MWMDLDVSVWGVIAVLLCFFCVLFINYKLNLDLKKGNNQHDNCSFLNSAPFFSSIFTSLSPKNHGISSSSWWKTGDPNPPGERRSFGTRTGHRNLFWKKNGRLRCWLVGFSLGDGIFIIPRTYSIHLVDFDGKCGINVVLLGLLVFCFVGGYI